MYETSHDSDQSQQMKGGDDQDVVEMDDPKLRMLEEKSEFQYLTSPKQNKNSKAINQSDRDNQKINQVWHATKQNSLEEINQEGGDQFDKINQGLITRKVTLDTSDKPAEQKRRLSLENRTRSFRHQKIGSEIKSTFKPSTPKQMDRNWELILKNKLGRKEPDLDYDRATFYGSNSDLTDSDLQRKVQDIENNDNRIDNQPSHSTSRQFNEDRREKQQILSSSPRVKRQLDINAIADAHFENSSSSRSNDSIEMITAEDRKVEERAAAQRADLLRYLGGTLLSVAGFSFLAYCFVKDPKNCVTVFGTGCPCCVVCLPCIRKCQEKMDMGPVIKENLNRYLPGVIIHPDGTVEAYDVSPEEVDIVFDIIDIIKE